LSGASATSKNANCNQSEAVGSASATFSFNVHAQGDAGKAPPSVEHTNVAFQDDEPEGASASPTEDHEGVFFIGKSPVSQSKLKPNGNIDKPDCRINELDKKVCMYV